MAVEKEPLRRAEAFCTRFGLRVPVVMAPMAGACPPALAGAVANAGGMGACGALLLQPDGIAAWAAAFRAASNGRFMMNLWVPDPAPVRDAAHEALLRDYLAAWGPAGAAADADLCPPDFTGQCNAVIEAAPEVASSIMGLLPQDYVRDLKQRGIAWWATVTTLAEARAAEAAGADVLVAQGAEAGGHRGCFDAGQAEARAVGLFALLPAVARAVQVPVVAAGGIADAETAAAALLLGASAVQVGTALLRSPEAGLTRAWADALAHTAPEDTRLTRAFSGRAGRSIATAYVRDAAGPDAPAPAPYPVQRGLTRAFHEAGAASGRLEQVQAWAGQSAMLARAEPAAAIVGRIAEGLRQILG